jgi:hypothetical protein
MSLKECCNTALNYLEGLRIEFMQTKSYFPYFLGQFHLTIIIFTHFLKDNIEVLLHQFTHQTFFNDRSLFIEYYSE